ncbi:MAG: DNA primase [Planctomycetota bacterium]
MDDADFKRFIDRVKLAAPIEEVVGRRVSDLKRAGQNMKACCPFHDEKTPSFVVTPERGTWRCFGACGEGGDAISFVQRDSGLPFREAVEELARDFGVELPRGWRGQRSEDPRKAAAYDALERAERFYARKLAGDEGAPARDYLSGRGLSPEILEAFGVGFAPLGNQLLKSARAGGTELRTLVDAGLVRDGDRGAYDFFRGRIVIPIRDALGRTVGFGARLLPGQEGPKYVNTSETPVFQKGRLIYGLDLARDAVRRERHVVLVEGYTDVMAAHQVGLRQVVAVLGTATTTDHATLIRRSGAQRATLLFDGDEAGRRAAIKALRGLLAVEGIAVELAAVPEGLDPCDAFLGPRKDEVTDRIACGTPWLAGLLEGLKGADTETLVDGVRDCLELLAILPDPIEAEARLGEIADALGLTIESLRERWEGVRRQVRRASASPREEIPAPRSAAVRNPEPEVGNKKPVGDVRTRRRASQAWGEVAGALMVDNGLTPVLRARIESSWEFIENSDARIARILRAFLERYDADEDGLDPVGVSEVMSAMGSDPARELVLRIDEHARRAESPRALADGAMRTLDDIEGERRRVEGWERGIEKGEQALLEEAERIRLEKLGLGPSAHDAGDLKDETEDEHVDEREAGQDPDDGLDDDEERPRLAV